MTHQAQIVSHLVHGHGGIAPVVLDEDAQPVIDVSIR